MKMEQFTSFTEEDRRRLDELVSSNHQRQHAACEDIIREGEHSPNSHLILSGLACRYKLLPDGSRGCADGHAPPLHGKARRSRARLC
jgi:hypothetical protein